MPGKQSIGIKATQRIISIKKLPGVQFFGLEMEEPQAVQTKYGMLLFVL